MKPNPFLFVILFFFSCVYDPPQNGKEVIIHNQTNSSIFISGTLNKGYLHLYDTSLINGRKDITRIGNYLPEYGTWVDFISDGEMNALRKKNVNTIKLYIINKEDFSKSIDEILNQHAFRTFEINIDEVKKHAINHLFIYQDKMLFEHNYSYTSK